MSSSARKPMSAGTNNIIEDHNNSCFLIFLAVLRLGRLVDCPHDPTFRERTIPMVRMDWQTDAPREIERYERAFPPVPRQASPVTPTATIKNAQATPGNDGSSCEYKHKTLSRTHMVTLHQTNQRLELEELEEAILRSFLTRARTYKFFEVANKTVWEHSISSIKCELDSDSGNNEISGPWRRALQNIKNCSELLDEHLNEFVRLAERAQSSDYYQSLKKVDLGGEEDTAKRLWAPQDQLYFDFGLALKGILDIKTTPPGSFFTDLFATRHTPWFVREDNNFGGDLLLYKKDPSLMHSDYSVYLIDQGFRRMSWRQIVGATRTCRNAKKKAMLVWEKNATLQHVIISDTLS